MEIIALARLGLEVGSFLPAPLLYIGPDVFLPLTSALAALAGIVLMFWQRVVSLVARVFGRGRVQQPAETKTDAARD